MEITYDPEKNARNMRERGLSFERTRGFEFDTALIEVDTRRDYTETRMTAIGKLDGVLHVLIFTERANTLRIISFRKANKREVRRYEETSRSRTDRR